MKSILPLQPASYRKHALHANDRQWAETNCYSDLVIELLHALGHEPLAALAFTLAIDFEGDQWTFFKFPHADLYELFGLEIQELAIWRPLPDHLQELVAQGRPALVELDSWYLPDTAGTAYQRARVKTTVAVNLLDLENKRLGYFHNQGYFELEGQDFEQVLQLAGKPHERVLPPYVEFVKREQECPPSSQRDPEELRRLSRGQLVSSLARAPRRNPFEAFKARFERDLPALMLADLDAFHAYSFANLRQYGACFELAGSYLGWLGLGDPAPFEGIAAQAKAFQFQLARSMARKKPLDLSPLDAMAQLWAQGMARLREVV